MQTKIFQITRKLFLTLTLPTPHLPLPGLPKIHKSNRDLDGPPFLTTAHVVIVEISLNFEDIIICHPHNTRDLQSLIALLIFRQQTLRFLYKWLEENDDIGDFLSDFIRKN